MAVIKIGSDEFTGSTTYQFEEEQQIDPEKEERILKEFKPIFIPEKRIPEFLKGYDCVVVNEFGDDYHMSEEEREKTNKFYKTFREFAVTKKRYRNVEEYVKVMRMAMKCLDAVAEDNGFYSPEKFKKMFMEDKIQINGLTLPELKGRESKAIDWKYLAEFILSDEPVENISTKKDDTIYTEEELEELENTLFDTNELDEILTPLTEEEERMETMFIDEDDEEEASKRFAAIELTDKQMKKIVKAMPEIVYGVKEARRDNTRINNASRFIYDLSADDFSEIEKYDQKYQYQSSGDIPKFTGDISNDDDYARYMADLEEYENTQIREVYNGKFKTREQIQELEIKKCLEANGYNLRNLYGNKEKEKKLKKLQRKDKKREKELKARLIKLKNRKQRRMGEEVDEEPSKKKKKKKVKKPSKKKSKDVKHAEKEMNSAMEEFLLASSGRIEGDFKDYKKESTDFTWDSIFGKDDK